jgi:hypothetical protein
VRHAADGSVYYHCGVTAETTAVHPDPEVAEAQQAVREREAAEGAEPLAARVRELLGYLGLEHSFHDLDEEFAELQDTSASESGLAEGEYDY